MPEPSKRQPGSSRVRKYFSSQFRARRDIAAGRDLAGRDIAGGDIAGGDIIEQTTHIGFNQKAVLSLVIVVGAMVFITALCFFSGGIAVGAGVFAAFNRPVGSSIENALSMQAKLQAIQNLPSGQVFEVSFSEEEISSYFRFILGPQIGVEDGKVRLLSDSRLAVSANLSDLGSRAAIGAFEIQENADQPLRLTGAAVQAVETRGVVGWVAVPAALLQPLAGRINQALAGDYRITDARFIPGDRPALQINGIATG